MTTLDKLEFIVNNPYGVAAVAFAIYLMCSVLILTGDHRAHTARFKAMVLFVPLIPAALVASFGSPWLQAATIGLAVFSGFVLMYNASSEY